MSLRSIALSFALIAVAASAVRGQVSVEVPDSVSLAQALDVAGVDNPAVRQATNELSLNRPERWTYLFGELMPSVSLNLFSTGYNGNLQRRATDNFGNPIASPTADWVYFSNTQQSLSLNWRIQGRSLFNAHDRRDQTVLERELAVDAARWTLGADVQRQFFEAQEQRELLDVELALLDGRRVDLESAELRFEVADASQVDVLDAEVRLAQQEIEIERQRAIYDQALLTLRQTLGGADVTAIVEEPLPLFDPEGLDEERLVQTALERNPDLRSVEAAVDGARLGVRESDESWWPTLDLQYNFSRTSQDNETQALLDFQYTEEDFGSRFFIQLSMPAFNDYFGMRRQQAGARVQLANQEVQLDQRRLQVEADVRSNLVTLRNGWRAVQIADRSAEIAQRSTRLAREEYRLGIRTFEELQTTVEQEATARRQALTSRYTFVDALLTLEELVGAPIRPLDASGIN